MAGFAGFPFKSFPRGWYQIAWSKALLPGEVKPLRYFGRDLVLYRAESGKPVVLDAFCRHLGAQLGYGGHVEGERIVCPFHGWKWGCDGKHLDVPYARQKSTSARIRVWTAIERSGLVLMWFDSARNPPDAEPPGIPEFDDPAYYRIYPHGVALGEVPFPPQVLLENAVDWPHLKYVHKWDAGESGVLKVEDRGRRFYVEAYGALTSSKGVAQMKVQIEAWGVGLTYAHLSGLRDMGFTASVVPIDESRSQVWLSAAVRRKPGVAGDVPDGLAKAMIAGQVREILGDHVGSDRQIWEHMEYQTSPVLVREEVAGWRALRNWTSRFYDDAVKPPPFTAIYRQ